MQDRIFLPVEASLRNPSDPSEVTLIADVSSVGMTNRVSTGQIVNWTADLLKGKAHTLIGKPVNVFLSDGRPTGHTTNVIGTIIEAAFDESSQSLRVVASLWKHYFPETIAQLQELVNAGGFQVSVEFGIREADRSDGITTPTDGTFLGVAIVDKGADPRNNVLILASALQTDMEAMSKLENPVQVETPEDEETPSEVLPMSFEWAGNQIAEYLSSSNTSATVTGTYPNSFYYATDDGGNYRVDMTLNGDSLTFGDPVALSEWDTNTVPNTSTLIWKTYPNEDNKEKDMEELAEVKASLERVQAEASDWKSKYEELNASVEEERAEREAEKRANDRIAEIEKIAPYKDDSLKTTHYELFKASDEKSFDAIKALIAATVDPKGGIASEGGVPATDEDKDEVLAAAEANLPQWRDELLARYGSKE